MPRKALPAPKPTEVALDTDSLARAQGARDELMLLEQQAEQNAIALAAELGYDGPLHPELLEHGIRQQMRRTVDACLETGRMLLLLKERVGHGNFEERVEALGMAPRAAQRFMQAAYKFSKASPATHLRKAIGSEAKLIEMLVLDDEEIKELAEGGTVRGITVDEIDTMTRNELRAALREAREDTAAKDRLIEEKNKKIDKLATAKKFKPSADAVAQTEKQHAQLTELAEATAAAEVVLMRLAAVVSAIETDTPSKAMRGRSGQAVQYLCQRLVDLIEEHGIDVDISPQMAVRPDWIDPLPGEGVSQH